ncbi:MAG: hypothetical protein AAGA48_28820 [Myxococcota bacterium]
MNRLEVAAELCRLSLMPNLAAYLRKEVHAPSDQLVASLTARRRKLQSLQSNAKYRDEALLVMRNFAALCEVCEDLTDHLDDMARRAELRHLPAIEMMLRGLVVTGPLPPDRLLRLRQGAVALGIRRETFDEIATSLLARFRPEEQEAPQPTSPPMEAVESMESGSDSLWEELGTPAGASEDELEAAYALRMSETRDPDELRRIQIAHRVLSHPCGSPGLRVTSTGRSSRDDSRGCRADGRLECGGVANPGASTGPSGPN